MTINTPMTSKNSPNTLEKPMDTMKDSQDTNLMLKTKKSLIHTTLYTTKEIQPSS
jgi:hypothetical protein